MKSLWQDPISEFHGEHYDLRPCQLYPKPVQTPHPPIHVGGESDAALRRVARHGQGWFTLNRPPEDLAEPLRPSGRHWRQQFQSIFAGRRSIFQNLPSPKYARPPARFPAQNSASHDPKVLIEGVISANPDG